LPSALLGDMALSAYHNVMGNVKHLFIATLVPTGLRRRTAWMSERELPESVFPVQTLVHAGRIGLV
jgi:hypothetical protein